MTSRSVSSYWKVEASEVGVVPASPATDAHGEAEVVLERMRDGSTRSAAGSEPSCGSGAPVHSE